MQIPPTTQPLIVANPPVDQLVDGQMRFEITGSGPVSGRTVHPITRGAKDVVAIDQAAISGMLRRVLQLVEHAAGGPGASSDIELNGISLSTSQLGLGANTYRAHLDDDDTLRYSLRGMSTREVEKQMKLLAAQSIKRATSMHANVLSGWLNIGPEVTTTLLDPDASARDAAHAVRVLLHESVHAANGAGTDLSNAADHAFQEAHAELRSTQPDQLRNARRVLGFDSVATDADLDAAAQRVRPYRGLEQALSDVLDTVGAPTGSPERAQLLAQPAQQLVDTIVKRLQDHARTSPAHARRSFDEQMRLAGRQSG